MEFDRQQLGCALAAANLKPTEQNTAALAGTLKVVRQRHRSRQGERQQVPDKKDLLDAVVNIRDGADNILRRFDGAGDTLQLVLNAFKPTIASHIEALSVLRDTAEQARYYLEFAHARRGRQEILTDLCLDLFDLYRGLTGKKGMAEGGPLYRFEKECVAMLDPDLVFPEPNTFRGCLMAADKRRREGITCKDLVRIPPLDLRL